MNMMKFIQIKTIEKLLETKSLDVVDNLLLFLALNLISELLLIAVEFAIIFFPFKFPDESNLSSYYPSLTFFYDCFNFLLVIKKSFRQGLEIEQQKMLTNLLQLAHSLIILTIFYNIYTDQILSPALAAAQLMLTIIGCISERKLNSKNTKFQLLLSLSLGYFMFPNKSRQIGWIFFVKAIKIHLMFKSIRKNTWLFKTDLEPNRYFAFVFDFFRFSLNEYMLMGIFCAIYTYFCDEAHQPIPQTHKMIYQLIVTASTIGYGDLTPKSKMQIMFFTYTIPVLCASFVIYMNNLVQIYTNTFLAEQEEANEQKN